MKEVLVLRIPRVIRCLKGPPDKFQTLIYGGLQNIQCFFHIYKPIQSALEQGTLFLRFAMIAIRSACQ